MICQLCSVPLQSISPAEPQGSQDLPLGLPSRNVLGPCRACEVGRAKEPQNMGATFRAKSSLEAGGSASMYDGDMLGSAPIRCPHLEGSRGPEEIQPLWWVGGNPPRNFL